MALTHNRRIMVEVAASETSDSHIPSLFDVYPDDCTNARPPTLRHSLRRPSALTRIERPDDWSGHPHSKTRWAGFTVEYRRRDPPPMREGLQLMSTPKLHLRTAAPSCGTTPWFTSVPGRGAGRRCRRRGQPPRLSASWSTWVRSTPPPTASLRLISRDRGRDHHRGR